VFSFFSSSKTRALLANTAILLNSVSLSSSKKVCFEDADSHDNTLHCSWGLSSIVAKLVEQCNITDVKFDATKSCASCANYFVDTYDYCSGYFSGSVCQLDRHNSYIFTANETIDNCIQNVISNTCRNGYGTSTDIIITAGLVCATLAVGYGSYRFFSNRTYPQQQPNILEHTPLLPEIENESLNTESSIVRVVRC